jgi:hypothetical protein
MVIKIRVMVFWAVTTCSDNYTVSHPRSPRHEGSSLGESNGKYISARFPGGGMDMTAWYYILTINVWTITIKMHANMRDT